MATFTTNLNLRKPDGSDFVDEQADLNANWDTVDSYLNPNFKRKTANTSRASTVTLADDPHLVNFSFLAGEVYELTGVLFGYADSGVGSGTPDMRMRFNGTATGTMGWGNLNNGSSGGVFGDEARPAQTIPTAEHFPGLTNSAGVNSDLILIKGLFVCTGSGDLDLQWAQMNNVTRPSVLAAQSFIHFKRMA